MTEGSTMTEKKRKRGKHTPYVRKTDIELLPLDLAILERLPEQGTVMGYHHIGATVKQLQVSLKDGGVTSTMLNGRLRNLRDYGYVTTVPVLPVDTLGWQRTPKGKSALTDKGVKK